MYLCNDCFVVSFLLVISLNEWFCFRNTLTREVSDSPTSKDLYEGYKARIVNGSVVSIKDYPYNVYILTLKDDGSSGGFSCSGSIIGKMWILTSGHCLPSGMRSKDMRVYVGSDEKFKGKKYNVKRAVKHPEYKCTLKSNVADYLYDYMLLELKAKLFNGNLAYGKKVQNIILGKEEDIVKGNKAILTAFGSTILPKQWRDDNERNLVESPNTHLRMAEFKIKTHCKPPPGKVIPYEFCAVGASTTGCMGDSGGPLAVDTENGTRLIGVMSHGCKPEGKKILNFFASVPFIETWIFNVTGISNE